MFEMARALFPFLKSSTVSNVNEEYVLKPPQKPVSINNLIVGLRFNLSMPSIIIKPKTMQLKKLEINVANGNDGFQAAKVLETRKRAILPKPPPKNTRKTSFIYG